MNLLDLPLELVQQILLEAVQVRTLKRALRLRLVSRQFRHLTNDAIFRARMIDDLLDTRNIVKHSHMHSRSWPQFVQSYLARLAWQESDITSPHGRIRRAAQTLCEDAGDVSEAAVKSCIWDLCDLALLSKSEKNEKDIGSSSSSSSSSSRSTEEDETSSKHHEYQLNTDVLVASVYLNKLASTKRLLSQGFSIQLSEKYGTRSDVFGTLVAAVSWGGHVEALKLLLAADKTLLKDDPFPYYIKSTIILHACAAGSSDLFNFVLDSGPFKLPESGTTPYNELQSAIGRATTPELYTRAATTFGKDRRAFGRYHLLELIQRHAGNGNAEMTRFFLERCVDPKYPESFGPDRLKKGALKRPFLRAVESGNEEIVKLMLDYGADPNWISVDHTALTAAVRKSRLPVARLLLERGAEVNKGTPPPIVLAIRNEDLPMVKLLGEFGAVFNTTETGALAMAVAKMNGLESMVHLLAHEGVKEVATQPQVVTRKEAWSGGRDRQSDWYFMR